jgi:hypothetical protein
MHLLISIGKLGGAVEVVEKYKSNFLEGILLRYLADAIWKLIEAADRAENNGLGRKARGGVGGERKAEAYEDMIEAARALNRSFPQLPVIYRTLFKDFKERRDNLQDLSRCLVAHARTAKPQRGCKLSP